MTIDTLKWSPENMLEVTIKQPDDFLKVRETLTRIGVASRKDKTLFQSCHILHKQGKYFIVVQGYLYLMVKSDTSATILKKKHNRCIISRLELISIVNGGEDKAL